MKRSKTIYFVTVLIVSPLLLLIIRKHRDSKNAITGINNGYHHSPTAELFNFQDPSSSVNHHPSQDTSLTLKKLSSRVEELSKALEKLWCLQQDVTSSGGFCVTPQNILSESNKAFAFDQTLCSFVEQLTGNVSIADFGAGIGYYGMCFLRKRTNPFILNEVQSQQYLEHFETLMGRTLDTQQEVYSWHGFDAALNIDVLSGGFIQFADLSQPGLWLGRRWDWIMSIEVGEHIAAEREDAFLDNLVRHACKGIILTWAIPYQPGHKHVNNRPQEYIKSKMSSRGLTNEVEIESQLREFISLPFLRDNAMVFKFPRPVSCLTA